MELKLLNFRPGKLFTKMAGIKNDPKPVNVDLQTKINSGIRNYFYDIPIDGQVVQKNRWLGIWPEGDLEFASKVIQTGNILSLTYFGFSLSKDNFWDQSVYPRLVLSTFWTFNSVFRAKLIAKVLDFRFDEAFVFYKELDSNFFPYKSIPAIRGGEYEYARIIKYPNALQADSFKGVLEYDYKNRLTIKLALKNHCLNLLRSDKQVFGESQTGIGEKDKASSISNTISLIKEINNSTLKVSFIEMLKAVDHSVENTMKIIKGSLELANTKRDIFSPPVQTANGKNPKGFNGTIAAMVTFFFDSNFFMEQYSKEDIMEAYLFDYNIEIPKYKGNFDLFKDDFYYNNLIVRLRKLKINRL